MLCISFYTGEVVTSTDTLLPLVTSLHVLLYFSHYLIHEGISFFLAGHEGISLTDVIMPKLKTENRMHTHNILITQITHITCLYIT